MTQKQFAELLKALRGIETALYALRVPNTVYVPQVPYVQPAWWPNVDPNTTIINTTCSEEGFNS